LYASAWRIVNYVNLQGASDNVHAIGNNIDLAVTFCIKNSKLWQEDLTVCNTTIGMVRRDYEKIQEMRKLVLELTRKEWNVHRQKRGIFNSIDHVAH
jgi:hypothetical protein